MYDPLAFRNLQEFLERGELFLPHPMSKKVILTHVHISLPYTLNKHFRNENPIAIFSISYIFKYNILFLIKFEYFNILSKKKEKDNANSDNSAANSLEDISLVIQDISQRIRINC